MFDPASIGAALTSVKVILDLAKGANDVQLAIKISAEIANLQGRLIDVQQQALSLQSENQALRDEIRKLRDTSDLERSVVFRDGAYWRIRSASQGESPAKQEEALDGPFCPSCWTEKKLRRAQVNQVSGGIVQFLCSEHKTPYCFEVPERLVRNIDLSFHRGDSFGIA
jgi:hypothetical protein